MIETTFGYILDNANWEKFCELKRYNPWMLNEGLAESNDKVRLTFEEADKIELNFQGLKHD